MRALLPAPQGQLWLDVVVENITGGGTLIGADETLNRGGDGYTCL
jgi:hypothetical protein